VGRRRPRARACADRNPPPRPPNRAPRARAPHPQAYSQPSYRTGETGRGLGPQPEGSGLAAHLEAERTGSTPRAEAGAGSPPPLTDAGGEFPQPSFLSAALRCGALPFFFKIKIEGMGGVGVQPRRRNPQPGVGADWGRLELTTDRLRAVRSGEADRFDRWATRVGAWAPPDEAVAWWGRPVIRVDRRRTRARSCSRRGNCISLMTRARGL
jgi:hypothetical protein